MFHKEGTATGSQASGAQAGTPAHSAACAGRNNRRGQGRHPNGGGRPTPRPSSVVKLERGAPPKIIREVTTLRGRRNKNVTFVRHLEEYEINPVSFANDVSKRFATSATIDEDPKHAGREALKKKNHVEIGFQGNIGEELQVLLTGGAEGRSGHGGAKGGSYKVPKNVIDLRLEKRVSARRKP